MISIREILNETYEVLKRCKKRVQILEEPLGSVHKEEKYGSKTLIKDLKKLRKKIKEIEINLRGGDIVK